MAQDSRNDQKPETQPKPATPQPTVTPGAGSVDRNNDGKVDREQSEE